MKILAIRGKNLASLEGEFEIDFTVEPLKSAGIFAITGSTGAGKSTLLDALCLALFDDTPRTNWTRENIAIPDVRDRMINQKDSRTILRRGTGEGYAEVDFLALGGECFRSCWLVKRARGKADGSLQNSEIRLTNLSESVEVQGRKTELLAQIVKLIGLTFDQFTRSVLLAQGDFATFLKARQSEKAELLEKLTGTEIYSRISMVIYEKSKHAEQEYNQLLARIKDIELLPDERFSELNAEKQHVSLELEELKKEITIITEKIKWIRDEQALQNGIRQAEKELLFIQRKIEETKPRYDYLALLEIVQEIRDEFQEWRHVRQQLEEYGELVRQKKQEAEKNDALLKQAVEAEERSKQEWSEFCEKAESIEPQIIQARELDVRLAEMYYQLTEANKELSVAGEAKVKVALVLKKYKQELALATDSILTFRRWFEEHRLYETLIPRIELLVGLLEDSLAVDQQLSANCKIRNECRVLLEEERVRVMELQEKAGKLQKLLPAEIMEWRARLQDGLPCPVCGSIHHPLTQISSEQSLQEEELERAKKRISEQIQALSVKIETRQNELTRLETLIGNYKKHSEQIGEKLEGYLTVLPEWKNLFREGLLQKQLKEIADQWIKYTSEQARLQERLGQLQAALEVEEKNARELCEAYELKAEKRNRLESEFEKLQQERKVLLRGKVVEVVVAACSAKKKELEGKWKKAVENCHVLRTRQEAVKAAIGQCQQEINRCTERYERLQKSIDQWMERQERKLDGNQLTELFSRNLHWLQEERKVLHELKEHETSLKATLADRKNHLLCHLQAQIKPQAVVEDYEFLQSALYMRNQWLEQKTSRVTEICFALATHQKGIEKIRSIEKELEERAVVSENWKKLNDLLGSASGSKFKEIAQGYTLDILLGYANKHLRGLTERYVLQRIPDTLALQVMDLDMLGETRTVHSLSGGEAFLISLALALGLASLSSNRMNVESLFIDEGFGSLDAATLRVAMDALEHLQTQGRKICVISHVTEMTERIGTQIQVLKTSNGRSEIKIIG